MGPCIVSIFQYISKKMQRYTVYLYLETLLHVLGGTSTHHQERIQLYLQHLVFVTPLLLSAAIVEELEPVWVCCGWRTPPTAHSNKMQLYTVYWYLETALHVSGVTSTHHQERIQLYLQHLVFVTPLLLSAAIVEELELVWVCCGWRKPPTYINIAPPVPQLSSLI